MITQQEVIEKNLRLQAASLLQQSKLQEFHAAVMVARTQKDLEKVRVEAVAAYERWLDEMIAHDRFHRLLREELPERPY